MEGVPLLQKVVAQTTEIVDNITPDQLGKATPCAEWTVRDLINHITAGATIFAISAEQGSVPDAEMATLMGGDNLGDDYRGAWKAASAQALSAFEEPGVLEKIVTLPFGPMPAGVALNIAVFDVTTHACDLARATGQRITDTELLETALTIGRQMVGPELRQAGVFDPERAIPADAPVADRLLCFAGRRL